jgi:cell wall-associated NlpC family hydrolase
LWRGASAALASALALTTFSAGIQPTFAHVPSASTVSRGGSVGRDQRALMSRGAGFDAPAAAPVSGEVAIVINDNAAIYAGREDYGTLLTRMEKGSTILVTGQTDSYYAVAMNNHTTGFILKSDAQLQNIQITTSGANATPGDASNPADSSDQGSPLTATQNIGPLAQGLLQSASNYLGIAPYVWGGNTIAGIDCSGFVKAVYAENGIKLPRTAAQQATIGYDVPLRDLSQWQPGDRMYFMCHHDYIDHTGMYIGNGYFIHSSIHHHGVDIDKVESAFYWDHLVAVRRSAELLADGTGTTDGKSAAPTVGAPDFESNQE